MLVTSPFQLLQFDPTLCCQQGHSSLWEPAPTPMVHNSEMIWTYCHQQGWKSKIQQFGSIKMFQKSAKKFMAHSMQHVQMHFPNVGRSYKESWGDQKPQNQFFFLIQVHVVSDAFQRIRGLPIMCTCHRLPLQRILRCWFCFGVACYDV